MKEAKDIFIGVDGGGTKTKIIVEDISGNLLGQARSGPANIRTSIEQSWQSIDTGVEEALRQAKLKLGEPGYRFHIGLGLAGTEDPEAREKFLARPHSFATLILDSDAYAACLGVHECQDGAIIIIGTGVIGLELYQGKRYIVGGWGFPQGDKGGGAWLGMEAVRLAFKQIDGRVSETGLIRAVLAHFNNRMEKMVSWSTRARPVDFASLAPYVTDFGTKNDPYAIALIQEAAQEIDEIAQAMEKRLPVGHTPLPCCLLGGIAPYIEPHVKEPLKSRLVSRKGDPAKGAIYMLRLDKFS